MQKIKIKNINRILVVLGIILTIAAVILFTPKDKAGDGEEKIGSGNQTIPASDTQITSAPAGNSSEAVEIPAEKVLTMPFQSQAPFFDWSEPWQNACEEASINIVRYYFSGQKLSNEAMRDDILKMVDYQIKNWGGHEDLNAEKTLKLAWEMYGIDGEVVSNYSVESIKQSIADGIPVIVPTDGRLLNNPNFRGGGPSYHMIVIKGYDSKNFITNDPGTRKGEGYIYSYQTLLDSIKNPDGGSKEILILSK